jgi:CheY-like chemotaxis protein
MDEDMPVMTGVQALRAIRQRRMAFGPVVLIAMTGYNTEPDLARLLREGFDSVIGKPFALKSLSAQIQKLVGGSIPMDFPPTLPIAPQEPWKGLLDRLAGDERLARKLIAIFLQDTPKRMAGIQEAIRLRDARRLVSLVHALKGAVAIFGAVKARDHAQRLQELGRAEDFRELCGAYQQLKEEIAELEENLRGYAGQNSSPPRGASRSTKRRGPGPRRTAS